MATLTIRMPDTTHERLRHLAKARNVSMNKLIEEFSIAALAEFDAEARFRVRAARGDPQRGLVLLAKLDRTSRAQGRNRPPRGDLPKARTAAIHRGPGRARRSS